MGAKLMQVVSINERVYRGFTLGANSRCLAGPGILFFYWGDNAL